MDEIVIEPIEFQRFNFDQVIDLLEESDSSLLDRLHENVLIDHSTETMYRSAEQAEHIDISMSDYTAYKLGMAQALAQVNRHLQRLGSKLEIREVDFPDHSGYVMTHRKETPQQYVKRLLNDDK